MTQPYALYNPATHVAVPREPTQEILVCDGEYNKEQVRRIYTVILKAVAAPPHVVEIDPTRSDVALAKLILERLGYSVEGNQHRLDWVAEEICKFREVK